MAGAAPINRPYLIEMEAEPSVEVDDFVYNNFGIAGRALASSLNTMPAIGYVVFRKGSKVYVSDRYVEKNVLNVEGGKYYYISHEHAGKLTDVPPSGLGRVKQCVARGLVNERLAIHIDSTSALVRGA